MTASRIQDTLEDQADEIESVTGQIKALCLNLACIYHNDVCQELIAEIQDDVLPRYEVIAGNKRADAPQQAVDTVNEMKREMRE